MKRDYFRGKGKPKSDYNGVSALYMRKDGTIIWRAHIFIADKLHIIGTFTSEKEAAEAYDKYVIEHNLSKPLNKDGVSYHFSKKDKKLLRTMSGVLSVKALAKLLNKEELSVFRFLKKENLTAGKNDTVIVIDKRDNYEE